MALIRIGAHAPNVAPTAWVAGSASVIGRVELAPYSSVWYGCTLRADNDLIRIGEGSNVQDGSVLHTDPGFVLDIGAGVTVGHQCMLHGCTIGDGSLVGIQSVILNGARIGRHCLVGAGSLVTQGKSFPDGSMIMGRPAKLVRALTAEEIEGLAQSAAGYVQHAQRHRDEARHVDAGDV
ncbi:MAG TPA: gamma carbonic anhydrase family protein [Rubrivivax sp.]|nr:gamma carbonic anhydrase family protein [Burkholderiales bacterium]HNT39921.1 gamma carbonic anhydrase family protein [Rubrivivax sp.]